MDPWEPVLTSDCEKHSNELGLLEEAEKLDLRAPIHDYFDPLFSTGWSLAQLNPTRSTRHRSRPYEELTATVETSAADLSRRSNIE